MRQKKKLRLNIPTMLVPIECMIRGGHMKCLEDHLFSLNFCHCHSYIVAIAVEVVLHEGTSELKGVQVGQIGQ